MLPFTAEQFLAVFVNYNNAIWPIQIAAYLLGGISVALLFWKTREADRAIAGILAVTWLWTGVGYHGLSFSVINKAAYLFAALFIVQGCCLVYVGVYRHQISFGLRPDLATGVGAAFVVYAAIVYPLIGVATGHHYPEMPMFGVAPCPVTIFTLGMLLLTVRPVLAAGFIGGGILGFALGYVIAGEGRSNIHGDAILVGLLTIGGAIAGLIVGAVTACRVADRMI